MERLVAEGRATTKEPQRSIGRPYLQQLLDFTTVIVASIGQNEQRAPPVTCLAHLTEPQINGVKERCATLGCGQHHLALEVFNAVGKGAGEFGALIEAHKKEFVIGISSLEELDNCLTRTGNLVAHAAAVIEDHADRNGNVFRGKGRDLLFNIVFKHAEVSGIETRNLAIVGIGDRHIDQGGVYIQVKTLTASDGDAAGVLGQAG